MLPAWALRRSHGAREGRFGGSGETGDRWGETVLAHSPANAGCRRVLLPLGRVPVPAAGPQNRSRRPPFRGPTPEGRGPASPAHRPGKTVTNPPGRVAATLKVFTVCFKLLLIRWPTPAAGEVGAPKVIPDLNMLSSFWGDRKGWQLELKVSVRCWKQQKIEPVVLLSSTV